MLAILRDPLREFIKIRNQAFSSIQKHLKSWKRLQHVTWTMNWNTHMYSMNTLFWIHPKVKWLSDASFLNREKTCLPAQWIRTQDQPRLAKQKIALQLHHLLLGNAQGKYAQQFFFNVCGQFCPNMQTQQTMIDQVQTIPECFGRFVGDSMY